MKKFDPVSVIGVAVCVLLMVLGGYYTSRQARIAAASQARQAKNAAAQSPSSPQHSAVVVSNESAGSAAALPEQLKPVVPGEPVPMGVEGLFEAEVDSNGSGVERVVMQRYAVQTREKDRKQQRQVLDTAKAPFLGLQVASTPLYQSAPSVVSGGVVTSHRMDGKAMIAFDEPHRGVCLGPADEPELRAAGGISGRGQELVIHQVCGGIGGLQRPGR